VRRPIDVWFALRRERFSTADAKTIAGIYKQMSEGERDLKPWAIATAVCARTGMHPEIWHERLTVIFSEAKELSRA